MIASTPSAVYPLYDVAKTQGKVRIYIRPRLTIPSNTPTTTTSLPLDILIEEYMKKKKKNRFDDWHIKINKGHIMNSSFVLFVNAFVALTLKASYC